MSCLRPLLLTLLLASGVASAQTAAPAVPAAGAAPVPVLNCPKPDNHPGRLASPNQVRNWGKEVVEWTNCYKKYVAEVSAQADEAVKVANAAVAKSNAAVNDYNAIVKDLQAQNDANSK